MLNSMTYSPSILAETKINIKPSFSPDKEWADATDPYSCLGPNQKKELASCYIEKDALKAELDEAAIEKGDSLRGYLLTGLSMLAVGFLIGANRK